MGLRKTSADSLATLYRPDDCASFSNPFSGSSSSTRGAWGTFSRYASKENEQGSQAAPVNPWSEAAPVQAKSTSLRSVQRGSSAAIDVLRGSPQSHLSGWLLPSPPSPDGIAACASLHATCLTMPCATGAFMQS